MQEEDINPLLHQYFIQLLLNVARAEESITGKSLTGGSKSQNWYIYSVMLNLLIKPISNFQDGCRKREENIYMYVVLFPRRPFFE